MLIFVLFIFREDFEMILKADTGELKIHHKLQDVHIHLPPGANTSVKIASQTFSRTSAKAICFISPEKQPQANIVQCVNDVSNTSINPSRGGGAK